MASPGRKTRGRQKVPMVRMERITNCLVTFSKRRSGLFKKASELCTLTGSEVAIVVFSPGRKAFSFGHPSVDTLINRFLGADDLVLNLATKIPKLRTLKTNLLRDTLSMMNKELAMLNNRVEVEKKLNEEIMKLKNSDPTSWWLTSLEEPHLKQLLGSLIQMRENLFHLGQNLTIDEAKGANLLSPFFMRADPNVLQSPHYYYDSLPMPIIPNPISFDPFGAFQNPSSNLSSFNTQGEEGVALGLGL